jgi:hypothetical protein
VKSRLRSGPKSREPPGSASAGLGAPIAPHHGDPFVGN